MSSYITPEREIELYKLFIKHKLDRIECEYNAGGDSMGDTNITFYKKGKEDYYVHTDLCENEWTDYIYDNVEFYGNSDGHYLGEFGKIIISKDEDEDKLEFIEERNFEYSENYNTSITDDNIKISTECRNFLLTYVNNIEWSFYNGDDNIDYISDYSFKDMFYTQEIHELVLKSLKELMNIVNNDDCKRYDDFPTEIEDLIDCVVTIENNKITLNPTYRYTCIRNE